MIDIEKIVDVIFAAIKSQNRDNRLKEILGEVVNPEDLEKLENELRDINIGKTLYPNDPIFRDWVKLILEKYL